MIPQSSSQLMTFSWFYKVNIRKIISHSTIHTYSVKQVQGILQRKEQDFYSTCLTQVQTKGQSFKGWILYIPLPGYSIARTDTSVYLSLAFTPEMPLFSTWRRDIEGNAITEQRESQYIRPWATEVIRNSSGIESSCNFSYPKFICDAKYSYAGLILVSPCHSEFSSQPSFLFPFFIQEKENMSCLEVTWEMFNINFGPCACDVIFKITIPLPSLVSFWVVSPISSAFPTLCDFSHWISSWK